MFKLLKYSKPYLLLVLASVGLLFAQANLELALPDYLSNIVDTGIQQGGVENAVPVAIRQSEMERLFIFTSDENETSVLADYTLINENSSDYESYLEQYPVLTNESIYVLNDDRNSKIEDLNQIITKPIVVVFSLEQLLANPENATEIFESLNFTLPLPPPDDFFNYLSLMPF